MVYSAIAYTTGTTAASLKGVCTVEYAQSALPAVNFIQGITFDSSSDTTNVVYNASTLQTNWPT